MNLKARSVTALNGISNDVHSQFGSINGKYRKLSKGSWDSALPFPRVPTSLSVILVGAAAVVCYVNSLDGGFVFDDSEAIVNNEDLKPETPISNLLHNDFWGTRLTHNASHKSYRPLTVLSFRWNYWLAGGLHPRGFHLTNVALHATVSMLSLAIFNLLLGGACPRAALLAAVLFAVHPIHAEAVAGVVGRADLLCALFYFLAFIAYCSSLRLEWGVNQAVMLVLSMTLCAIAMFCKEQGITVIGLCSIYDIIVSAKWHPLRILRLLWRHLISQEKIMSPGHSEETADVTPSNCDTSTVQNNTWKEHNHRRHGYVNGELQLRPILLRHVVLLLSGLSLLFVRWRVMASAAPTFQRVDNPASFADSIFTRVMSYNYIYALNGWLLLCPEWLCFDWSMGCIPLVETVEPRVLAAILFWVILAMLIWRSLTLPSGRDQRNLTMSLAALVIPFLPATNIFFRVGFVIAERVLYLPSIGYCLLVVVGLRQFSTFCGTRRAIQIAYVYVIFVFSIRAAWRSAEWQTEAVLFRSGLSVCPLNAKVHYNIAKNAGDAGNRTLAVYEYREALRLHSEYDQAMNNLANILKDEGKLNEAEDLLRKAVELRPDFAAAWMNLGIVLAGLKRHSEAESSYFTALAYRKKYPDCYYNLGNLYLDQQRYEDAYRAWRNATTLKPTHTVAWSNMIIMLDSIDDVNMLGENPQTIRGNVGILLEASKAIGLEVNPEKTKYMIMSRDQNIVRNGTIKIGDLSFEEVEKFKYLGATVTNINGTREEIKHTINMGNACYYSVEKLLSSSLLSKNLKVRIYKTVILPVVLYGCETWTLSLREEQRLRVFENKVLRKIFGAKRDEVTGEWRKLHNTELHALYSSPDIIRTIKSRRLRWAGHVARMGESRNAYRVLVGRPEGKRPLGRPKRRWEDNIKMDLREVGYDGRDWSNLAQDRDQWRAYVRAAMNLRVP
ncbi:hypothetical protein ANN_24127 [Periplaneta americana]|uniref:dolichyl-phosphate-mannose--protein mannosyltransferase n=1 Tax=Periplaneta americana TaxID=6978 RepID=A0ABQ8S292_PERAM|nr:hypothetical protein ANN_24127 [Periplaneta americana]